MVALIAALAIAFHTPLPHAASRAAVRTADVQMINLFGNNGPRRIPSHR